MTSTNGENWEIQSPPNGITNFNWQNIGFGNNNTFVAIARSSSALSQQMMISNNGKDWRFIQILPFLKGWSGIAFGNGLFVAVMKKKRNVLNFVLVSENGINWTSYPSAVENDWV